MSEREWGFYVQDMLGFAENVISSSHAPRGNSYRNLRSVTQSVTIGIPTQSMGTWTSKL